MAPPQCLLLGPLIRPFAGKGERGNEKVKGNSDPARLGPLRWFYGRGRVNPRADILWTEKMKKHPLESARVPFYLYFAKEPYLIQKNKQ